MLCHAVERGWITQEYYCWTQWSWRWVALGSRAAVTLVTPAACVGFEQRFGYGGGYARG